MENQFENFMKQVTGEEHMSFQERPNISNAQSIIGRLQETLNAGRALSRDERNEARALVHDLEGLQMNVEPSPESDIVLDEIKIALTRLRDMLETV